ncbi:leucyl aminopeptidase [Ketogulonicigenium vulgare]|uniref:Probable cytosol aminopeptidase n=1 Tax=Ketogulonicigenium vulgare (strain WSH-001) TaxID=759362 RepID=F9Y6W8_KETVW|nr:leucyl aminopeptidase [Ketogulonicigenium vulgare]ADO42800.1 leucyl aminopeptidase [Ketogulonicigenium vulgare Y25]AEM40985.1 Leucine aminopeptidase protein [Ketogulonicigenium vulgare WSH-001]ALJ81137.1 aminopeptidase [Ketogulonicigenium vulgare]ANW33886.1 leucyl aminopeptidase [Ketogulonicigenium vulgare]AOZ54712.1 leucyl aminopeptidase [Ketogulonicigenium vulgare]
MTTPLPIDFRDSSNIELANLGQNLALIVDPAGKLDQQLRKLDVAMRKSLTRLLESEAWLSARPGGVLTLGFPVGITATQLLVVSLPTRPSVDEARAAGAALAAHAGPGGLSIFAGHHTRVEEVAHALALRSYAFSDHKSKTPAPRGQVVFYLRHPEVVARAAAPLAALAEGVFFTRDLVNEPANILTTTEFAKRIADMADIGLKIEILDEDALRDLGMNLLLAVGQGSTSPTKVAIMHWEGATDTEQPPLALIGKGVIFDTGGISLKNPGGMERMTMDMGGAGLVCGVMRTLALRRARANVVGVVGLVENMPAGNAYRPGDVFASMKGDTVEIISTDAEGRLLLADVMWYAQKRFKPTHMIDFATLTGNIIAALGSEYAGLFSNDETLTAWMTAAGRAESEGIWPMPMSPAFDESLKSLVADVKNKGAVEGGAIIAARFLSRFVADGTAWAHVDIAGVTSLKGQSRLAPAGATGWGVGLINRLIHDHFETH